MSEVPTPSDPPHRHAAVAGFLACRQRWSGSRSPDAEPWRIGFELADAMDEALAELAADGSLTVVAVGGYGARQLCLHSDVDLLLLHDGSSPPEATRRILYPLWDASLKVGHSLRTVREALAMARQDLTALCALLTSRLVAGPAEQFEQVEQGLARLLRGDRAGLPGILAAQEAELWASEPFPLQNADLKGGRGGLRSVDRLRWDRSRARLVGEPAIESPLEEPARRTLLGVRAAVHAVRGRPVDRYDVELRAAVGAWLGRDPLEVAAGVYGAMRTVDTLAGLRWNRIRTPADDPVAALGAGVVRFVRARWARPPAEPGEVVLADARRAAHAGTGRLSPSEYDAACSATAPRWSQEDRNNLVALLAAGAQGWEAISMLWESGWIDRALPEIAHLRAQPQPAPFHLHTTDVHLARTVHELLAVADGAEPWCGEVADELGALDEALLAAFLHDAGKGLGGDHSERGAELATDLLDRLGFEETTGRLVGESIRHHLLLPEVAFRRDLDDQAVIDDVAARVGDLHSLQLLSLLTVADARATGNEVWSSWRSSLLRGLHGRVAARLTSRESRFETSVRQQIRELVGARVTDRQIDSHLDGMPPGYLRRFGARAVASHLDLLTGSLGPDDVRLTVTEADPVATVVTAARDRTGLLARLAGVFSLHDLAVLEARVATRSDGIALDTFRVIPVRPSAPDWQAIEADLGHALVGSVDVASALGRKRAAYSPADPAIVPSVELHRSGRDVDVEVRINDRIGLLHDLAATLAALGLEIRLAKVDTRGSRAVDVFTVGDPQWNRAGRDDEIRRALLAGGDV